ncbi:MAG: hypothetical protein V8R01_03045 [Bacilli bacterium]
MGFMKKIMGEDEDVFLSPEEYYDINQRRHLLMKVALKMILLEPRAYSEAQQIANYLKKKHRCC